MEGLYKEVIIDIGSYMSGHFILTFIKLKYILIMPPLSITL